MMALSKDLMMCSMYVKLSTDIMNRQCKLFFSWQSEDKKSRKTLDVALQNAVDALNDRGTPVTTYQKSSGNGMQVSKDVFLLCEALSVWPREK